MKKILCLLTGFMLIGFYGTAQNNASYSSEIYEITAAEVPIPNVGSIEPISTEQFDDTIKVPKAKDYWNFSGIVGLNVSQTGLFNWAGGGNNNATGVLYANLTLKYKKNKIAWDSNLDTDFGLMYVPETLYPWRKSNDKIVFSTKLGYEFSKTWFVTVLGGFRSQYVSGYEYKMISGVENENYVSNWASPSYSDLSVGIDWKPNAIFSLYLSPVAGRVTTCTDSLLRATYGVPIDQIYKADLGLTFKAGVNYSVIKNLKIISIFSIFSPYTSKIQPFGNFDVDWDFSISYQFLKVLNVSLNTSLKYYDQVMITDKSGATGPRVQFKEVIGLGIGYSF